MSTNGRLPADQLVLVQAGIYLERGAAAAWFQLEAAVLAETGVDARISDDGGYRSYAAQERLTGTGHHQSRPGHSVHGWGRSVDVFNWRAIGTTRLDAIARRFGFVRTIAHEPWHYELRGGGSGSAPTPIPIEEEETMKTCQMHYTDPAGVIQRIAFTPGTAWYLRWNEGGSTIANGLAASLDTASSIPASASMFAAIIASADRVANAAAQKAT